jgi:hypothetical protein
LAARFEPRRLAAHRRFSVAWVNPPGRVGWAGLTDITLGVDRSSAEHTSPGLLGKLDEFTEALAKLQGARRVTGKGMRAYSFAVQDFSLIQEQAVRLLGDFVTRLAEDDEGQNDIE